MQDNIIEFCLNNHFYACTSLNINYRYKF